MFVISLKTNQLKGLVALAVGIIFTIIGGVVYVFSDNATPVGKESTISFKADTTEERQMFFRQFGYETDPTPVEVKEIIIPETFDEVFKEYNELQKAQGFDLTAYAGKRVKCRSYRILNYPEYENSSSIRGNIITYNGTVIASDLSNIELQGFTKKLF